MRPRRPATARQASPRPSRRLLDCPVRHVDRRPPLPRTAAGSTGPPPQHAPRRRTDVRSIFHSALRRVRISESSRGSIKSPTPSPPCAFSSSAGGSTCIAKATFATWPSARTAATGRCWSGSCCSADAGEDHVGIGDRLQPQPVVVLEREFHALTSACSRRRPRAACGRFHSAETPDTSAKNRMNLPVRSMPGRAWPPQCRSIAASEAAGDDGAHHQDRRSRDGPPSRPLHPRGVAKERPVDERRTSRVGTA